MADSLLPSDVAFRFRPVAAYKRELGRGRINKLRASRVAFRGQDRLIRLVRCGSNLAQALDA